MVETSDDQQPRHTAAGPDDKRGHEPAKVLSVEDEVMASRRDRLLDLRRRQHSKAGRDEDGRYLRPLLQSLRSAGARGRRVPPPRLERILSKFAGLPVKDERFDWSRIPGAQVYSNQTPGQRDHLVRRELIRMLRLEEKVVVIWNPHRAGFRLRARDLLANITAVLEAATEVWIMSADQPDWLIEVAGFDNEVCSVSLPGRQGSPRPEPT